MFYIAILFLSAGIVSLIIHVLGARFGTLNHTSAAMALVGLVVGAGLAGGAYLLRRSNRNTPSGIK
jgi:predicted membrane-bound mannosyltransferase